MEQKNNLQKTKIDVVVLMAGEGKRMRPFTIDRPKALIKCEDGLSLFNHIVNAFSIADFEPTFMPVIGHGAKKVHEEVAKINHLDNFNCIYNPFYDTSGPIISLLFGMLQTSSENVIVINGDTLIQPSLTEKVAQWMKRETKDENIAGLCVSVPESFTKDDMKVAVDEKGEFEEVGKAVTPTNSTLKSAGVFCIKGRESKKAVMEKLQNVLMDSYTLKTSYHWHNIVNEIKEGFTIDLVDVKPESWHEIDTPEELEILSAQ